MSYLKDFQLFVCQKILLSTYIQKISCYLVRFDVICVGNCVPYALDSWQSEEEYSRLYIESIVGSLPLPVWELVHRISYKVTLEQMSVNESTYSGLFHTKVFSEVPSRVDLFTRFFQKRCVCVRSNILFFLFSLVVFMQVLKTNKEKT